MRVFGVFLSLNGLLFILCEREKFYYFLSPESFQSCVALHHLPLYRREAETDGKGRSAEPFPSGKGRQWEEADPAFGEHAGGDQRVLGRLGKKRCLFRQGGLSSDGNGRIDGKFQNADAAKKRYGDGGGDIVLE